MAALDKTSWRQKYIFFLSIFVRSKASLNLFAAFDTVDHSLFIYKLQYEYGIGGVALQWFRLYLLDRNQIVSVQGRKSNIHHSTMWVSTRICTRSSNVYYVGYTRQLSDVINKHDIDGQTTKMHS